MRKVKETFEGGCSGIVKITESCLYNAYCSESCHLERDGDSRHGFGGR